MKEFDLAKVPWATLGRPESFSEITALSSMQRSRVALMNTRPVFSIVSCGFSPQAPLYQSLLAQSYPHWELWVHGDPVPVDDSRVRFVDYEPKSEGEWFERARRLASGAWIGYLGATDVLSPSALFLFAVEADRNDTCDFLYCNEVYVTRDYRKARHHYSKSAYSWFNLIHFNCVGRAWFARMQILSGLDFDTAVFERDLFFRISEESENWGFIPAFLCYRSGQDPKNLPHREPPVRACLKAHLSRKSFPARVESVSGKVVIGPRVDAKNWHRISVITCFRDQSDWTVRCLQSIKRVCGEIPVEVVLINNRSHPQERARVEAAADVLGLPFKIVDDPRPFNFGLMNNEAVAHYATGNLLLFLNNDVFLSPSTSLDAMAEWAVQEGVGVVGLCLRFLHGGIQHGGFRALYGGQSRMVRVGHCYRDDVFASLRREVFGNTFAACMVRRSVYESQGGLRAVDFPNGFGDVAFNLACYRRGLHNLYLGDMEGLHIESASRGQSYEYWEEVQLEREFPEILQQMLRADTGLDLVPQLDFSWRHWKELVLTATYKTFPALLALRAQIKYWLFRLKPFFQGAH